MGLHLCYELRCPADVSELQVSQLLQALRDRALALPFHAVSELVRLNERDMTAPSPLRGLRYERLEHVLHFPAKFQREMLYWRDVLGLTEDDLYEQPAEGMSRPRFGDVPVDVGAVCIGFAVAPGRGSEPATFGLCRLDGVEHRTRWWWHCCCKTQYASMVSDEHLVRCHTGLVAVLDALRDAALDRSTAGITFEVRDETGFWETRDTATLLGAVAKMNRIVAAFAGRFTDAMRESGGESANVGGAIFEHPEFERLETEGRGDRLQPPDD